jgi:hypothetical protein
MSVQDLYQKKIKPMSVSERYKLATLIMKNLGLQDLPEYIDTWTEEDIKEASLHSFRIFNERYPEDDDLV